MLSAEIDSGSKSAGSSYAQRALNFVASIVLLLMMVHIVLNVATRYLFNMPLQFTHEIVSYWYMPAIIFAGFVMAKSANEHIEAPLIFDRLSKVSQLILVVAASVIGAGTCALLAYFTFNEFMHGVDTRTTGGTSALPIWPLFILPPLVFVILVVQFAADGVRALRGASAARSRINIQHAEGAVVNGQEEDTHRS